MSKKEETTEAAPAIESGVLAISESIAKGIKVEKDGNTTVTSGLFESNLPEGLTMEQVIAGRDYTADFVAGSRYAFGLATIEAMKSNKKLEKTSVEISLGGKDFVSHSAPRSTTYPGISKPGEEPKPAVTKYAPISTSVTMQAGRNVGAMKKVSVALAAMAQNALA